MLRDDIRSNGLLHPIVLHEGLILDGRHRYSACQETGQEARLEEYRGTDAAGYVASACIHRNLTTSQRALIAAGFLAYEQAEAKKRSGTRTDLRANLPGGPDLCRAREKAGERMHVGGRTVDDAAKVLAQAVPATMEIKP